MIYLKTNWYVDAWLYSGVQMCTTACCKVVYFSVQGTWQPNCWFKTRKTCILKITEPLLHSPLFFLFWRERERRRGQLRWQSARQTAPFVLTATAHSHRTQWRGQSSLWGQLQQQAQDFCAQKTQVMQSLMVQRQITMKIRNSSDCSQYEANIPPLQFLEVSYWPKTCYIIGLTRCNRCFY